MKKLNMSENNKIGRIPKGLVVSYQKKPIGETTGEIIDLGSHMEAVIYENANRELRSIIISTGVTLSDKSNATLCFVTENDIIKTDPEGYVTDTDDQSALKLNDTRKTRLTLDQLNKLRIINDVRRLEFEKQVEKLSKIYSPQSPPSTGFG